MFQKSSPSLLVLVLVLGINGQQTFAQIPALTPKNVYAAGVAALNANDCARAVNFFAQVQTTFANDPKFILSMAKAQQCAGNKPAALTLYLQYQQLAPNVPEIDTRIGQLQYEIQRDKDNAIAAREAQQAKEEADQRSAEIKGKQKELQDCHKDCNELRNSCYEFMQNRSGDTDYCDDRARSCHRECRTAQ